MLTKNGYTIYSYDHTGCRKSEGKNSVGLAQSLNDLDHALNAIESLPEYKNCKISVVGHSWGGFAALNIPKLHPELDSVVAISGFLGVEAMARQLFPPIIAGYRKTIVGYEKQNNPVYALFDARDSLKDTKVRTLVIHSSDDKTVRCAYHFDVLQKALSDNKNISFIKTHGKGHHPYYTEAAIAEFDKMMKATKRAVNKKLLKTSDDCIKFRDSLNWEKITEQDEEFWNTVFNHIGK